MKNDPWNPFSSEAVINLANSLVLSKVSNSQIDVYFAEGLGGMDAWSFRSAYTFQKHLDVLDPSSEYLTWTEAAIVDGQHTTTFYYRNAIDCVTYLVRQVAYRSDMFYAPIPEYDSSGERYTLRCIPRTGGGIHRYEIGSDRLQVVAVSHANLSFCSILANSFTRVNRQTHYRIVRLDSVYQFLGR